VSERGAQNFGSTPCVVGECGLPFDINDAEAFKTGNFVHQANLMDAIISAMEGNLVHFT